MALPRPLPWLAAAVSYRRWVIAQRFRTYKTQGFDIEERLVAEQAPLRRPVTAALVAAIDVQHLVHACDDVPGLAPLRPVTDALEPKRAPLVEALRQTLEGKPQRRTPRPLPPAPPADRPLDA